VVAEIISNRQKQQEETSHTLKPHLPSLVAFHAFEQTQESILCTISVDLHIMKAWEEQDHQCTLTDMNMGMQKLSLIQGCFR